MDKYKVGDILIAKDDSTKMFEIVQIVKNDQFPIKTKGVPYAGVRTDFEFEHADEVLINLGGDLSRVLYE